MIHFISFLNLFFLVNILFWSKFVDYFYENNQNGIFDIFILLVSFIDQRLLSYVNKIEQISKNNDNNVKFFIYIFKYLIPKKYILSFLDIISFFISLLLLFFFSQYINLNFVSLYNEEIYIFFFKCIKYYYIYIVNLLCLYTNIIIKNKVIS